MQRVSVRFEGRVQGVGFRVSVAEIAGGFAVVGRVANVLDGNVDLQAEGEPAELLGFLQAIEQRLSRYIVQSHQSWSDVSHPNWTDFDIGSDLSR